MTTNEAAEIPFDTVDAAAEAIFALICDYPWGSSDPGERKKAREFVCAALKVAAPHIEAKALSDAALVLDDLPIRNLESYAIYEEWKDSLNVNHGVQAVVRWLNARAAFMRSAK